MKQELVQPAAAIAGALLAANPNALRDPDAVAKVFIATYRQLEKASTEIDTRPAVAATATARAAAAAAAAKPAKPAG